MAVRNLYPNLPGHLVEFKDGGLQVSTNTEVEGYNKSLLILGTAFDGPINEPVKVDATTVTQLFGSEVNDKGYPNGATLTKYAKQAFKNGFSDVRCMRITGKQASVEVVKSRTASTEVEAGTSKTLQIGGTKDPIKLVLNKCPIAEPDVGHAKLELYVINGDAAPVAVTLSTGYGDYDGNITIEKNTISKKPSFQAKYSYTRIYDAAGAINDYGPSGKLADLAKYDSVGPDPAAPSDPSKYVITRDPACTRTPITTLLEMDDTAVTGDAAAFDSALSTAKSYKLDFGITGSANETKSLYATPYASGYPQDSSGKFPITPLDCAVKIVAIHNDSTEEVLENGTDFTLSQNVLTLKSGGKLVSDDNIRVEYYLCDKVSVDETLENQNAAGASEPDDVVEISPMPVKTSIKVYNETLHADVDAAGTSYNSGYTVVFDDANNKAIVTFKAGQYAINTTLRIDYDVENVISESESFIVQAVYGGSLYNGASVAITEEVQNGVTGRRYTFNKPDCKKYGVGDKPFYFTSFDCKTVGELKLALARYALNNVFEIIADNEDLTTDDFPVTTAILSGGDDGVVVTNNELYEALSGKRDAYGYLTERGSYQILENYHCDYIYVAGVYADSKQTVNKFSSFQHELALLCAVLTYRTKMTHGFMDVKPNSNTTLVGVQKYVDKLVAMENLHYMQDSEGNDIVDSEGKKMDIGWYTSLVVGPDPVMVSDKLGTYYGSPAIAYAALCASLKPESAPTNKALPGVKGMKYRLSNKQMNDLTGNRMVCFRLKNEGVTAASSVPYCVDGVTSGAPNCDYTRMSTVKVVTDVVDQIREVADPFIGEPNTVEQRNALSALISKRLSYLLEQGEIQFYEFEINATIEQVLLGECTIALTLVPPMELRKITTVVSLRAAA